MQVRAHYGVARRVNWFTVGAVNEMTFLWSFLWICVGAVVGAAIAESRGQRVSGVVIGAILGPIGWLILLGLDERPKCPACLGRVNVGASKCCRCGSDLPKPEAVPVLPPVAPPVPPPEPEPLPMPQLSPGCVVVTCPQCDQQVVVEERLAREGVICPHCDRGFVPRPTHA